MIPLRDSTRSRTVPVVVYATIAACVGVFLYTIGLGGEEAQRAFFETYGAVPRTITQGSRPDAVRGLLSSIFMHGSWAHLVGNMLYLWVFGDNVEDAMGHGRFVIFYLVTGVAATLSHVATQPASPVPLVGASGAIAGVLGAYLILYPRARILTAVLFVFVYRLMELPALIVLPLWFLLQLVLGFVALGAPNVTTVAWWAHVGGFVAGATLVFVFARRRSAAGYG